MRKIDLNENNLMKIEQEQLVIELCCSFETMSEDIFNDLYPELNSYHQIQVDDAMVEFENNAIGSGHWNSDDKDYVIINYKKIL